MGTASDRQSSVPVPVAESSLPEARLEVREVTKRYVSARTGEEVYALKPMTLEVGHGEFLSIVGPSGCGKSTLLKMIAGLESPSSGEIAMDGEPTSGPSPARVLVFQQYALFPWKTVRENVEFGLRAAGVKKVERERRVARFISMVGLGGFENKYPHELSGGMQQRCALARALVVDPVMLLMDEPLAAVDAQTRVLLQEELLQIWGEERTVEKRQSVVYVTHNIDEAVYLSDRVIVMSSRPGSIKAVVDVALPRPRTFHTRTTPECLALIEQIWVLIRDEITLRDSEAPIV
ncbi:MAG: ABC transporter ATP-binding protein [Chloroflexota bacterium]|nr:ABC transporter ATP-binding protein [Chloroflexota bacterium]